MRPVTLALIGDVMLGRKVDEALDRQAPESFWGTALPVLRQADAVLANLECAISARGRPWAGGHKVFLFRARPTAVNVLRAAGTSYVSLANNHTLDFGFEALLDTVRHLDDAGIKHAGAGRTIDEAMEPAQLEVAGIKIGVIALTDNEEPFAAGATRPGTYFSRISAAASVLAPIRERVARLKAAGAAVIVLSLHWGPNMRTEPTPGFRRFAHAVLDAGVHLIHGHSAHVFQAVEARAGGLVLYDTGDFLDDYAVDPTLRNDWSLVFLVDVEAGRLRRLRLLPVRLGFARVDLATGAEAEAIKERMRILCRRMGTRLDDAGNHLELTINGCVEPRKLPPDVSGTDLGSA